jgi:N-acetylglucosaminyldiphosphoundecaprenol N-acetyl-beta-D-mannosaminyltransferase
MAAPTSIHPLVNERILGQPVHPVSKAQAASAVVDRAITGVPGAYVCLTNVHTTVESERLRGVREAADGAYLSVPDGMPLAWLLRRRGHPHTEKVTGIEFMPLVAATGVDAGLRHYLYGGSPGVAEQAARGLQDMVPDAHVVGASSAPFAEVDRWPLDGLREELARTRPQVLWIGLGAPKQELWMARMSAVLDVPVMIGVGAAFDYLAGTKRAAPTLLRHVGLEWLFRLAVEPRRLWRRYLVTNSTFVWRLVREGELR